MIYEKNIEQTLETFSFPRLSGTHHERKAFKLALKKIEDLDLDPQIQEFKFSTFFSRVYPKLVFFLSFLLIFFLFLFGDIFGMRVLSLVIICIIFFLIFMMRKPEQVKLYKNLNSANIYVKLLSKQAIQQVKLKNNSEFFFFCHLDSKGQRFSLTKRVRATRAWVFTLIIMIGFIFLRFFLYSYFFLFILLTGLIPLSINAISTSILMLNTTNNNSSGVIDNASGIACVYELLRYYTKLESRLKHFNTWFVFTGSEECGTIGIRNFYKIMGNLDKKSVFIINFDAIGKNIFIFDSWFKPEGYIEFYKSFINNKKGLMIFENPKKITVGTHSDGYFLKKKFYQGFEFGDIASYGFMHSDEDNLGKVDPKILKALCEVIIENLKELDELHAK